MHFFYLHPCTNLPFAIVSMHLFLLLGVCRRRHSLYWLPLHPYPERLPLFADYFECLVLAGFASDSTIYPHLSASTFSTNKWSDVKNLKEVKSIRKESEGSYKFGVTSNFPLISMYKSSTKTSNFMCRVINRPPVVLSGTRTLIVATPEQKNCEKSIFLFNLIILI